MYIVWNGVILSMILTAVYGTILTETMNEMEKRTFSNDTKCNVNIGRNLVRCDTEPQNNTVPSGSFCSFNNKKDVFVEPDILFCDNGFFIYAYHNRKGTDHTQWTSKGTHHISKRFWWIALIFIGIEIAISVICHFFCHRAPDGSIHQNHPPKIKCPSIPDHIAEKSKDTVVVTWSKPTATDEDGDKVTITKTGGDNGESGDSFLAKSYVMEYEAKDEHGNGDKCLVRFTVKVISCNMMPYVANGRAKCDLDTYIYGTSCNLTCNKGHELPHNTTSVIHCDKNGLKGSWVPPEEKRCKKKKCKPPPSLCNGKLTCSSKEYEFDSVCYPSCNPGYSTDQTQNYRCNGNTWEGNVTRCIDIEPPVFKQCPNNIQMFAEKGKGAADITWPAPTADDNSFNGTSCDSNPGLTITQVSGGLPGSSFKTGHHEIRYKAVDESNNEGFCTFSVVVEELSCNPLLVEDEFLIVTCPTGYLYGSTCSFSCFLSYKLVGDSNVTCEKDQNDETKTFWQWSNNTESYCEKLACPELPAPAGGALACSEALGNKICTMSCSDEYLVAKGTPTEYVCNDKQVWIQGIPPNCTDYVHPSNAYQPGELFYYYTGNCSDTDVHDSIKQNFVDTMQNLEGTDGWQNICPAYCTVEGVTVTCGPLNGRRKRELYLTHKIAKRSPNAITVNFRISSEWERDKNMMENDNKISSLSSLLKNEVSKGTLDVAGVTTGSVAMGWTELSCPVGQEPIYDTKGGCDVTGDFLLQFHVGCPPGKYLKDGNCKDCEKGFFQDKEYQINCTQCPYRQSTLKSGSTSQADCLDMCPPGQFSSTGLIPCSPCPVGHYQSNFESKTCKTCPSTTFTVVAGSTKITDCHAMDYQFTTEEAFIKLPVMPKSISNFSLGFYMKCPERQEMSATISLSSFNIILGRRVNFTISGQSISVPLDLMTWTRVVVIWEALMKTAKLYENGKIVASEVYHLLSENDMNIPAGSTVDIFSVQIGCLFSGFFLTDDVLDEKILAKEQENCVPPVQKAIYTMNSILTSKRNGTELLNSQCDAIDECKSNPCGESNICINKKDAYSCICNGGYTGSSCKIPPDFCATHRCGNGAVCLSHFSKYTCKCSAGYTGVFCEHKIINGNWGQWSKWSDCSASCNGGVHTRQRYCNNPIPDSDGLYCLGSNTSQEACNTLTCPECPPYFTIYQYKNSLNCSNKDDTVSCKVTCQPGFVFARDQQPLDLYECGPKTGFAWPAKPPPCSSSRTPHFVQSSTSVRYHVNCDNEIAMMDELSNNLKDLQCVKNKTCSMKTVIDGCATSNRNRRSSEVKDITIQLTSSLPEDSDLNLEDFHVNKIVSPGLAALINAYTDSAMSLEQMNTTDVLTVDLDGIMYEADMSTLSVTTTIDCPNGTIEQELVCVACPFGTFWNNGICEACLKGTFQDEGGQMQCKQCPTGYSTLYKASKDSSECSVQIDNADGETSNVLPPTEKLNYGLVVAVPIVVILLIAVFVIVTVIIYRKLLRKKEHYIGSVLKGSVASLNMVRPSVEKENIIGIDMPKKQCIDQ